MAKNMIRFGGGGTSTTYLLPNVAKMRRVVEPQKLVFENIGTGPLYVILCTKGRGKLEQWVHPKTGKQRLAHWLQEGPFLICPTKFAVNGTPLGDGGILIPANTSYAFTIVKGDLRSIDGADPVIEPGFLIPDKWLPSFTPMFHAAVLAGLPPEESVMDDDDDDEGA